MSFSQNHPFIDSLIKRIVRIVVTWNVVVACLIGTLFIFGIIGAVIGVAASSEVVESDVTYRTVHGDGSNQIVSIKVSGIIMGSDDSAGGFADAFSMAAYGYDIKDQLISEADANTASGIILEIDSPGGTIYGSRAIADGVAYYKSKTNKPVYAHIQGMGASGAYWAAASADKIYVDYGSDVGSIGVIMGPFEYYDKPIATNGGILGGGVVTQNGVESMNITAGTSKDVGNPYRRLTAQELQALQKMVNNEYDEFVKFVSKQRGISDDDIRNKIGAMGYDSKSALELKLVDKIGSRENAYHALAEKAGVQDDFHVVRIEPMPSPIESFLSAAWQAPQKEAKAQSTSACSLSQSVMVYRGDLAALCKK